MRWVKEVSGHLVLAFGSIVAVFWLGLMMLLRDIAGDEISALPEIAFLGYGVVDLMLIFAMIGEEGREVYAGLALPLDMGFAVIYGVFLGVFWVWLTSKVGGVKSAFRVINFIKPVGFMIIPLAICADIGEDIILQNLLNNYPDFSSELVPIASGLTEAKWMVLAGYGILCLLVFGLIAYSRRQEGVS